MTYQDKELSFSPGSARWWMLGPFLAVEGIFLLTFLTFSAVMLSTQFSGARISGKVLVGLLGIATVWLCAFLTNYAMNALTLKIDVGHGGVTIQTANSKDIAAISDIRKICFLDTLRGWMYIVVYTDRKSYTATNFGYFDKEFLSIRAQIADWFIKENKADLIYTDRVTRSGLTRNKKLPPFIYAGFWKRVLIFSIGLIALTVAMFFAHFR